MLVSQLNKYFSKINNKNNPTRKLLLTLFILFILRFGNTIPLPGIDQDALKKSFLQLQNKNQLMQIINMYSGGGGTTILSPFSLGIIPFINASILIDLLTAVFPSLEKLQSEEGEFGRKKLMFYKKIVTLILAIVQSIFLVVYLKSYFYSTNVAPLLITIFELVSSAMATVWLSSVIDNQGVGNGTSLIIFTNIVITLIGKNFFNSQQINSLFFVEIIFLILLVLLICISQTARININVVSARQLAFLETTKQQQVSKKFVSSLLTGDKGLSIKLNQAGIFPIIIASNLIPFINIFTDSFLGNFKIINNVLYYLLIVGFNYFYTTIFWDPEKISEQLRKASVSIVNVTPGKDTILYLENIVKGSSILGGILLCCILFSYELFKNMINGYLLNQINISSLIILVGVAFEVQKNVRSLYKNYFDSSI
jgi:preprotein translocase subunit SecY